MQNIQQNTVTYQHDVNGVKVKTHFKKFITDFSTTENNQEVYLYRAEADLMNNNKRGVMVVDIEHMLSHDAELFSFIQKNFYKMQKYLSEALYEYMLTLNEGVPQEGMPKEFFSVSFKGVTVDKIRGLKTNKIGKLQAIQGTVTRTGQINPELFVACFQDKNSGKKINVEQQFKFTYPKQNGEWTLIQRESVFNDFQKVKVQEDSGDIPTGSMPRSVDIILRNDLCDKVKPGDKAIFVGTLLVVPDIVSLTSMGEKSQLEPKTEGTRLSEGFNNDGVTGLKQLGVRDLTYKQVFLANYIETSNSIFNLFKGEDEALTQQEYHEIEALAKEKNFYEKMSASICPGIYGHDSIKKGILLQLLAGINKKTQSGISLRGDLNICIVGDPSTAKSQFLKYVNNFLPRSVYTSGKASTSAGLTASVVRDNDTGEMCIEAGALMLADHGVCCIDEFDKMDKKDQVAIHEAMEQQTISITKAGIQATLNARASILAAANPVFGRYDKSKSLKFNLNLGEALMSRFDLFYVVIDQCDETYDTTVSNHILNQHRGIQVQNNLFSKTQIQKYVKYARTKTPIMTKEAAQLIQAKYPQMRLSDLHQKSNSRVTIRQLESIIRLSEALAKLHLSAQITKEYVEEACRLINQTILRLEKDDIILNETAIQSEADARVLEKDIKELELRNKRADKITYEQFENLSFFIIDYIETKQKQPTDLTKDVEGVTQAELIEAYISQACDKNLISSEKETYNAKNLFVKVIERLVNKEFILLETSSQEKAYQLHSNYVKEF